MFSLLIEPVLRAAGAEMEIIADPAEVIRIEMRPEQEGGDVGAGGPAEDGRVVAGCIDLGLEADGRGPLEKPRTGSEMGVAEAWATDSALGRRSDRGQGLEVGT